MRWLILYSMLGLAACGNTERPLRDLRAAGGGPDAFLVIPQNALEIPRRFSLPAPDPGGINRADPNPQADAIRALGGTPAAADGSVPAADTALVTAARRFGEDPTIRETLAEEDRATLRRARLTNLFNPLGRDRYFPAYARQALDPDAEAERLAALGVNLPAIPPAR